MKKMSKKSSGYRFFCFLFLLFPFFGDNGMSQEKRELREPGFDPSPYMGCQGPSEKAEVFLDGFISMKNSDEMCAAFSMDGREFFYNRKHEGQWTIFTCSELNGAWDKPRPVSFSSGYTDRDFTLTSDGNCLVFGSNRPRQSGSGIQKRLDLFKSVRNKSGIWSEPIAFGTTINTDYVENYPSMAQNGNLYFFSNRSEGQGGCEIYRASFFNGSYQKAVLLGPEINSPQNDWDAFISPDESFIIFSSQSRPDSLGGQDLYVAFRRSDGGWSQSVNMGGRVNSASCEICPSISLDGKYVFFTSRRRGRADIFWISSKIISDLDLRNKNE